jgi:S-adenosylmethionine hydrolase
MGVVYLASDFNTIDPYFAIMKSRIHLINKNISIIDLSHNIRSYDVEFASWFLYYSYLNLEEPKIICMVVDPGVGTNRKAIIVKIKKSYIIVPDNGILTVLIKSLETIKKLEFYEILPLKLKEIYIKNLKNRFKIDYEMSNTFHGRDIFAPAAGLIAKDPKLIKSFTLKINSINLIENINLPVLVDFNKNLTYKGKFVYYDHFGNLFTNFYLRDFPDKHKLKLKIMENDKTILELNQLSKTFAQKQKGEFLFYKGSFGFIEVAKNQSNALMEWQDWEKIKNFDVIMYT